MANPKSTKPTGQLNTWKDSLLKGAQVAAKAENKLIERPFFSLGNGQLKLQGAIFPNAEAPVVVLGNIHANLYYEGDYTPNNPTNPDCFALAAADDEGNLVGIDTWNGGLEMAPHKDVKNRVCDTCANCPMNEFGSAKMGSGKACQNTRRLATIPAGTIKGGRFEAFNKAAQFENSAIAYAKIPATSAKTFAKYVKDVAEVEELPTWGVFTKLAVVPNAGKALPSHVAAFEHLGNIPDALMPAVYERMKEAVRELPFPFGPPSDKPAAQAGKKAPAKRKYV